MVDSKNKDTYIDKREVDRDKSQSQRDTQCRRRSSVERDRFVGLRQSSPVLSVQRTSGFRLHLLCIFRPFFFVSLPARNILSACTQGSRSTFY